ncbi:hypothetical protein RB597_009053 [Gaeumannomyces tritici]
MAASPTADRPAPAIVQWVVDTRKLWPEATQTRQLETHPGASRALALLPPTERAGVLKYVFARDARMSLVSHLLKHYAVARLAGVPWGETTVGPDARSKPVHVDAATGRQPVAFNVSHQAGLVALAAVGCCPDGSGGGGGDLNVEVGVDVVSPSERRARDHDAVASDGWPAFVDMHADVFSPAEAAHLKYAVLSSPSSGSNGARREDMGNTPEALLDYKLRCFYALWCLREAYVKMTGDALVAPWLRELEFRAVAPPRPAAEGAVLTEHSIWLRGERVEDANVCLRSFDGGGADSYMICTAVRTPGRVQDGLAMNLRAPFVDVTVDEIVEFAEARASFF